MQLVSKSQHSLPGYAFLHDFTVTKHYYVIFRNPVGLALLPFLLGRKAAVHAVRWHPNKPLAAHLIPRPPANHEPTHLESTIQHQTIDRPVPENNRHRLESTIKHHTIDFQVPENNRHSEDICDEPLADHLTLWGSTHPSPTPLVSHQGKQHTDRCIGLGASRGHNNITRSPAAQDKPQTPCSLCPNLLRSTSAGSDSLDCNSTSAETSSNSNGNSSISSTLTDLSVHNPGLESAAMHSCQEQVCLTQQTGVDEHAQVLYSNHVRLEQDSLQPQHQSSVVLGQRLEQSPQSADKHVPQQQSSQADLHVIQVSLRNQRHRSIQGVPSTVPHGMVEAPHGVDFSSFSEAQQLQAAHCVLSGMLGTSHKSRHITSESAQGVSPAHLAPAVCTTRHSLVA